MISEKRASFWLALISAAPLLAGCNRADPPYQPVASIREIMKSVVEPNANFIWNSVATNVTAKGVEKKQPRTDDEWTEEHYHAIALVEATNLLLIPHRRVAPPGQKADNPDIERDPADIEAMLRNDPATFHSRIAGLRAAATQMLAAVDARDVAQIDELGGVLDKACEDCHMTYWYLPDK